MNTYFKKRIATVLILFVTVASLMAVPQRTYAWWGLLDTSFDISTFTTAVTSMAKDAAQWAKENYQKVMRDVIAKRIIDYTVDETVKWVQGGGDPKFVSDWDGFMKDAGAMAFDSVIKEAGMMDICQPFKVQLNIALIPEEKINRQRVECSISDIVANVEDFYENFENGGWLAYGASIKPENNLYMQLVMFDDEIKAKTTFNQNVKEQKAASGQGFLSVSKCMADDSQELYDYCVDNNYFDTGDPNYCYTYANENKKCTNEVVQTPGTLVGKAVGESITSDKEWAANIQSWTSALVNAAINRLTAEGLAAMTGSSPGASPSYDPAGSEYGDILAQENAEYQSERIQRIEDITVPYGKYVQGLQKAKGFTQQILDLFGQIQTLDVNKICVPQTSSSEVEAQQNILAGLNEKLGVYEPAYNAGIAIITQLGSMTASVRDTTRANQMVSDYEAAHPASEQARIEQELLVLESAENVIKTQESTLATIQGRFNQCKQKIELLNATSTSSQ